MERDLPKQFNPHETFARGNVAVLGEIHPDDIPEPLPPVPGLSSGYCTQTQCAFGGDGREVDYRLFCQELNDAFRELGETDQECTEEALRGDEDHFYLTFNRTPTGEVRLWGEGDEIVSLPVDKIRAIVHLAQNPTQEAPVDLLELYHEHRQFFDVCFGLAGGLVVVLVLNFISIPRRVSDDDSDAPDFAKLKSDSERHSTQIAGLQNQGATHASQISAQQAGLRALKGRVASVEATTKDHATQIVGVKGAVAAQDQRLTTVEGKVDNLSERVGALEDIAGIASDHFVEIVDPDGGFVLNPTPRPTRNK